MNQHLLPAGYEFQKVQHDYERLLEGKELFDRGTLEALDTAKDNNERHEQLERVRKDLLPFYDDVPAIAPEVIRCRSRNNGVRDDENGICPDLRSLLAKHRAHPGSQRLDQVVERRAFAGRDHHFRIHAGSELAAVLGRKIVVWNID